MRAAFFSFSAEVAAAASGIFVSASCARAGCLFGWLARPSRDDIKCQMKISPPSQIAFFLCFFFTNNAAATSLHTHRKRREREERRGGRILCQSDSNGKCYKPAHFLNLMSRSLCARGVRVFIRGRDMRDTRKKTTRVRCVQDQAQGERDCHKI